MAEGEPNYFTWTLGEADALRRTGQTLPTFATIPALIDEQAIRIFNEPAIGFAVPNERKDRKNGKPGP